MENTFQSNLTEKQRSRCYVFHSDGGSSVKEKGHNVRILFLNIVGSTLET